eukprot:763158-Hanusia_phi.AAC.5
MVERDESTVSDGESILVPISSTIEQHPDSAVPTASPAVPVSTETARIIAIDPGRVNLIYGLENTPEGETLIIHKCSRGQYYQESHINRNNRKIDHWKRSATEVEHALQLLSRVSSKTAFLHTFEEFLEVNMRYDAILWSHFCKRRCGRVRLDNYIGKKRFVDKFFNSLWKKGEQDKPIIAYGGATFASTGRGEKAVPVKWIKRECQRRYQTIDVDEYRTTKCCHRCGGILSSVWRRHRVSGEITSIRSLKRCESHRACCSRFRFVSRDKNAARNIMACF